MEPQTKSSLLVFFVNGKKIIEEQANPEWTLLYYLRTKLRLCGTKLGCGEGGCGACTVMVSKYNRTENKIVHLPVNACLAPICSLHGLAVTTVEGIGSTRIRLHPVQERIAKAHGSQCGFCTPGIVMSMYTLLRNTPIPNMKDLETTLQGNLCRCTGYRPIIEGFKTFTEEWELLQNQQSNNGQKVNGCKMGDQCCKLRQHNGELDEEELLFRPQQFAPYDPSQEPIFPPELKISDKYDKEFLVIRSESTSWYRPTNLEVLLRLQKEYPSAKIVVGNTEVGVETKFKGMVYPVIIQPVQIPEMVEISCTKDSIRVGASTTLEDLRNFLSEEIRKQPENRTRVFKAIVDTLNRFAGKQIRSVAAIGGNVMTASPISDILPILMASRVTLEVQSLDRGLRKVKLDNDFIVGYRKTAVKSDEILVALHIPYTTQDSYCYAYKQSRRRDDDIAIVNTAVAVSFKHDSDLISDIGIAFGGMSFKTVLALRTQKKLMGLPWNRETLEIAYRHLLEDLPLDPGAPGGMVQYRRSLTLSLFFRVFLAVSSRLREHIPHITLDPSELSAIEGFSLKEYKSSQYFTLVPETQEKHDQLHRPLVHVSALKQATGEAMYCDDLPVQENELHLAFVTSSKAHAMILSIDPSEALGLEGVTCFVSSKDIDEAKNKIGCIVHDEKIFYDDTVTSQGQIIGAIVGVDKATAQKGAKMVKIQYQDLSPVIVSIEDAIKHNSFFGNPYKVEKRGDVDQVLAHSPHVLEGQCKMGGQEHFYLETQCALVIPKQEDYEIEVHATTQNPAQITAVLSQLLDIQQHKIVTKVRRIGGGFGGKDTKPIIIAAPVAIAALKLNRPVRCMLDRDEDMLMTAGRHPFSINYRVAFDAEGRILGLDIKMYSNCGYSIEISEAVMIKAITHLENVYKIPTFRIQAFTCKTNLPSNTAFRGFGAPQGMFAIENIVQSIAECLGKNPLAIRQLNFLKDGDVTTYNQKVVDCTLDKCWTQCIDSFQFNERVRQVQRFNSTNRYKKRGLSCIPTKFGICFNECLFLNQAGALILVYTDGSVLLSHGGVEMGQGLHTKMIQVAVRCLGISADKIHTAEIATDKVPNTSSTAASSGSDLNGMAVLEACGKINKRLQPYKDANPTGTWENWVSAAYLDRVSLSATGFYKTPNLYNEKTGEGDHFNYYTYGVGCCEVEIDTLTGDHQVHRIDIVMDLGQSLNPAIDVGQIEGAFMQGYGLFVMEEMVYSPTGGVYTRGPGTYKIPGFSDVPGEFNVSILKGVSNPRAVFSSKAVGEPPLFLGSSVYFAIRDAIKAARLENGLFSDFQLVSPASCERIRMACQDHITKLIPVSKSQSFIPWNVAA